MSVSFGRCRSGRRWFWIAAECYGYSGHKCDDPVCVYGGPHERGWEDTEDLALQAASEAMVRLGGEAPSLRRRSGAPPGSAGMASAALKRINSARRKARPPKPGANGAAPVEYLYVPCVHTPYDDALAETRRWVQEVPVVRKTPKRIYYDVSDSWDRHQGTVTLGFISREEFEADTRCQVRCPRDVPVQVCAPHGRAEPHCVHHGQEFRYPPIGKHYGGGCGEDCARTIPGTRCGEHGYADDHCPHGQNPCRHGYPAGQIQIPGDRWRLDGWLFCATREAAEEELFGAEQERQRRKAGPELKRLRREMAAVHPDRGGSNEEFIAARKRYEAALRRAS